MWTCEKCNRTFQKKNQSHYCGEKPKSIDEYINRFDLEQRKILSLVRDTIHDVIPDATPCIKYSMPTFYKNKNLIHFAANKNHLGLYPGPQAIEQFKKTIDTLGLNYKKGTIQIPWTMNIPLDLIRKMAVFNYHLYVKD